VILVDTNVLLYATFADAPEHRRARAWLEERLAGDEATTVLCWPVLYAYARLATSRRVFGAAALTLESAWATVLGLLEQPATRIVVPGDGHAAIATELAATPGLHSADVPDVELAALAIEHGLVLASRDSGFRRFESLRSLDPLA
jgi:toxin-antitoxin system PIN domain toxin